MPELQFNCLVGAPADLLWPELLAVDVHAAGLPGVQSARVLPGSDTERTVEWSVLLRGAPLRWAQREQLDAHARTVAFRLVRGDLKRLRGTWSLQPADAGSIATLTVDADFGLPRIAVVFNALLAETLTGIVHGVGRSAGRAAGNDAPAAVLDGRGTGNRAG